MRLYVKVGPEVMEMKKGLVSIVIPVFNTEKYLERCITSVANQTYLDLEIILVDDGSFDSSPQICDCWQRKDDRIRVIHKKNQGLGMARNTGIANANGEYICFFDSDDYVDNQTIEKAYYEAKRNASDIVCFGMKNVDKNGKILSEMIPKPRKNIYVGAEVQTEFLVEISGPDPQTGKDACIPMSACSKLYSMQCINKSGWSFVSEREIMSEDFYSLLKLYRNVECISIMQDAFYYYVQNDTSTTHVYRENRYVNARSFYLSAIDLCDELAYPPEVSYRLGDFYLSLVLKIMKQEMQACKKMARKRQTIHDILSDSFLQSILLKKKFDRQPCKKRIVFWTMRHKLTNLCCVLLVAKNTFLQ